MRYEVISDHYKTRHTDHTGRNVAIIAVSHEGIIMQLPSKFGMKELGTATYVKDCASFEALLRNNGEPVILQALNSNYIE